MMQSKQLHPFIYTSLFTQGVAIKQENKQTRETQRQYWMHLYSTTE